MLSIIFIYLFIGAIAGILAGLLGIGGGLVIVPILDYTLKKQGINAEIIHHMALASSMGTILFTSITSIRAHAKRNAVLWPVVKILTPGIILGVLIGGQIVELLSTRSLKLFFVIFLLYAATQMILNFTPKATRTLPRTKGMFCVGSIIGFISNLVGIGGGTLSVPFLTNCNQNIHKSIGTSAAIGFPIAFTAIISYIYHGLGNPLLPAYSVGYIYLPAVLGIITTSMITAPIGAKLAHKLPIKKLKRVFAILLYFTAINMFLSII